jgi:hypothetical protein
MKSCASAPPGQLGGALSWPTSGAAGKVRMEGFEPVRE